MRGGEDWDIHIYLKFSGLYCKISKHKACRGAREEKEQEQERAGERESGRAGERASGRAEAGERERASGSGRAGHVSRKTLRKYIRKYSIFGGPGAAPLDTLFL